MQLLGFLCQPFTQKRGAKQTYTSPTSPCFIYRKSLRTATVFETTFWQQPHGTRATKKQKHLFRIGLLLHKQPESAGARMLITQEGSRRGTDTCLSSYPHVSKWTLAQAIHLPVYTAGRGKKIPAQEFVVSAATTATKVFHSIQKLLLVTEHWVKATLSASFEPCVHQQVKPATHLQEAP